MSARSSFVAVKLSLCLSVRVSSTKFKLRGYFYPIVSLDAENETTVLVSVTGRLLLYTLRRYYSNCAYEMEKHFLFKTLARVHLRIYRANE